MTYEEMERAFTFMTELYTKLEQFQVESEQRHAHFEVSVQRSIEATQRSIDVILQQQAKAEAEMRELKDWGKELAKGQVRVQNSVADLNESHKQLVEAQKKADDRFSSFLAALERRFGKNGNF